MRGGMAEVRKATIEGTAGFEKAKQRQAGPLRPRRLEVIDYRMALIIAISFPRHRLIQSRGTEGG